MSIFNKYWFKKHGKGALPATLEGWLIFALLIGVITQLHNFVDSWIYVGVIAAILAGIYFFIAKFKTAPQEEIAKIEKLNPWVQGSFVMLGLIVFFFIAIGIGTLQTNHLHATIGYPVRFADEPNWFEFHAIKDDFVVQLPFYPKYTTEEVPIANTGVVLRTISYSAKHETMGEFNVVILDLPIEGDYSNTDEALTNAAVGMKENLKLQTNEEPSVTYSEIGTFLDYPAIEFSIEGVGADYKLNGVYFIAGTRLFSLLYGHNKEAFNEQNSDRFTKSLRLEPVDLRQTN